MTETHRTPQSDPYLNEVHRTSALVSSLPDKLTWTMAIFAHRDAFTLDILRAIQSRKDVDELLAVVTNAEKSSTTTPVSLDNLSVRLLEEKPRWKKISPPSSDLGVSTTFSKFVGRDDSLASVYRYMEHCISSPFTDKRQKNPLCAACGAPGTGKSRLLVQISQYMGDFVASHKANSGEESHDMGSAVAQNREISTTTTSTIQCDSRRVIPELVQSWVPVLISFGNVTPWSGTSASRGLVLRLLCSHFVEAAYYRQFEEWLGAKLDNVPVIWAIEVILRSTGKKCIFLGVDEIMKTLDYYQKILVEIGVLLDTYDGTNEQGWRVFALVTSLDASCFKMIATSSGRTIHWVPLTALKLNDSVSLFESMSNEIKTNATVQCIISDCGGHPRSLEEKLDYNSISHNMETHLKVFVEGAPLCWIKPALLGSPCSLDEKLGDDPDHKTTYQAVLSFHEPTSSMELAKIAYLIRNFLITGVVWPPGKAAGRLLEKFHYGWEVMTGILRASQKTTLQSHYRGATFIGEKNLVRLKDEVVSYPAQVNDRRFRHHFSEKQSLLKHSVIMPGQENPGFDVVRRFVHDRNPSVIAAVELKYADEFSETKTTTTKLEENHLHVVEAFPSLKPVMIVVSRQGLPSDDQIKALHLGGLLGIVRRESFVDLYGPTLGIRPEFLASLKGLSPTPDSPPKISGPFVDLLITVQNDTDSNEDLYSDDDDDNENKDINRLVLATPVKTPPEAYVCSPQTPNPSSAAASDNYIVIPRRSLGRTQKTSNSNRIYKSNKSTQAGRD
ncbi:hypothetical protein Pelo_13712 [Pelomyxa schiedti]|nr:hypothetical protein Pelo_13712 [Pelomyxa schiedti]